MNVPIPLTKEEEIIFKWQYDLMGSFYKNLMKTISLADPDNLLNLSKAFPVHVSAFEKYSTQENWWKMVREKIANLTNGVLHD